MDECDAYKAHLKKLLIELQNERSARNGDAPWSLPVAVNEAQFKKDQAEAAYQKHIVEHRCLGQKSFVQNA
jgi:hypothetical protein